MKQGQERFGRIGAILAAAGSAVGLGNVWRFPYETGCNGGAIFILVYVLSVLALGIPIMIAEFAVGRSSRQDVGHAFTTLAPHTHWKWLGVLGVVLAMMILSYYQVVAGWTLCYFVSGGLGIGAFSGDVSQNFADVFQAVSAHPWRPLFWLALFALMTHVVVVRGVKDGIEKCSKLMMPLLLFLIVAMAVCSMCLPRASEGVSFLLKPDLGKLTSHTFLSAMGQAFFSLSVGMGVLTTYASHFSEKANLTKTAFSVALIDTLVALLAGFVIFPAAFSVGIQPDAGPSLVFITLPNVFVRAFGGIPLLSWVIFVLFFLLLTLAALTSTISLHEVPTSYLCKRFQMSRRKSATIVTTIIFVVGALCSLSLGGWADIAALGVNLFDGMDYLTAKIMMPISGMLFCIFGGWYLDRRVMRNEFMVGSSRGAWTFRLFLFFLRFVAPLSIVFIFLNELGLF